MPAPQRLPCSVLILAGGQGSRLGGRDKGLEPWHGRPLIEWVYRAARPLTDDLIISCNRHLDTYQDYADQLVSDSEPGFPGPLAGIRAGLAVARHRLLLVVPCDCPKLNAELLLTLFERSQSMADRPLMVRQANRWQPLFCIIPTQLADALERTWQAGIRSPRDALLELGATAYDLPEDDPRTANFNTPDAFNPGLAPKQGANEKKSR